ncbi:uncharacterized protein AMSG_01197 [Thecamonas trahens ATCC 50062]|uniref:Uncharacterized protein n=1 Tax=Thecamonas trahens ATCC 50062 TaxID=461836 RepID=A0A0L0DPX7_THETB|nr:hypothetical protein AMSG_01197 [Thecamonas trahens ATCC 50062]KNC53483.1 hypothetical protein AMSG_01197 [Thecamonas trahens ATCC 50062]|eukprot:XP_013761805.1 hypothetical protein AMSG_01197 [Thecamonas trahens ATCC 50062]
MSSTPLLLTITLALTLTLTLTLLTPPSSAAPTPCTWWPSWQLRWQQLVTNSTTPPPYDNVDDVPDEIAMKGSGKTYYDWSKGNIREDYYDFCVPIFPAAVGGFDFPCSFVNLGGRLPTSYLLIPPSPHSPPHQPDCCIFQRPWHAPAPDFLHKMKSDLQYVGHSPYRGGARWWQLDAPPSSGGPFGYGFMGSECGPDGATPAGFYFAAIPPYAFTIQNFFDFDHTSPIPDSVWDLPPSCASAVQCPNFPNITHAAAMSTANHHVLAPIALSALAAPGHSTSPIL